jgi:hypothetical protein
VASSATGSRVAGRLTSSVSPLETALRLVWLLLVLSVGCSEPDKWAAELAGWETVVLASQPFVLSSAPRELSADEPMRSLGQSSVCVVLKAPYPLRNSGQAEVDFRELLQGASISAAVQVDGGETYVLADLNQAWSSTGAVTSSDELSACLSSLGKDLPLGATVQSVRITSDRPLKVLGAYWQSMPRLSGPVG